MSETTGLGGKHDIGKSDFRFAVKFVPAPARPALGAIYGFCHALRADADLDPPQAGERVAEWRGELDACFRGIPARAATRELQPYLGRFGLKREHLERLVDGARMDADRRKYATIDELASYCEGTAGAAAVLALQVLGLVGDAKVREYTRNLSIALRLTRILVDLGADVARGRIYFPAEDFSSVDYSEGNLKEGKVDPPYFTLCRYEIARIRTYLRKAETIAETGLRRRLVAAEILRATCEEVLRRMERRLDDLLFGSFPPVPGWNLLVIAVSTWLEILVGV